MAWRVPRMWEGGECWIIGGGPSLPRQFDVPEQVIQDVFDGRASPDVYSPYLTPIHNRHVIGVNMAFKIGIWIDLVFFGDRRWYLMNRKELAEFPGLKVTCHPGFDNAQYKEENIRYLFRDRQHSKGISSESNKVSWNSNSGAAAISVAAHTGVKRIVLLGFDMRLGQDNKQHWHSLYTTAKRPRMNEKKLPFHRHLLGFPSIARDAQRMGIEIINACPDSCIEDFPKCTVKELLNVD